MPIYVVNVRFMVALFGIGLLLLFPMKLFNHFYLFSFPLMLLLPFQLLLSLPDLLINIKLKLSL